MSKLLTACVSGIVIASTAAGAAPRAKTQPPAKAAERIYCIQFEPQTGSHVAKTECRTRSEWRELGVDVDALSKK
jgi:hypothetical protein